MVGVQELWAGAHLPWQGLRKGRGRRDSGLALGGRLEPADAPGVSHFRDARGPDALKGKGVLHALVHMDCGTALNVLVTHLQAGRGHAGVRARQVDQVLEVAEQRAGPSVLMGDFNFWSLEAEDDASARRLEDAGFVDAALETGRAEPTYEPGNRYARGHGAQRFDRIYLRSGQRLELKPSSTAVLVHDQPLSDHHPVYARVIARTADEPPDR